MHSDDVYYSCVLWSIASQNVKGHGWSPENREHVAAAADGTGTANMKAFVAKDIREAVRQAYSKAAESPE